MSAKYLQATITTPTTGETIRISYLDSNPSNTTDTARTILLIHGFPQTSHQFRKVIPLLIAQGYRCIAPDYRGVGSSQPPPLNHDFRKTTMAKDILYLLDHLSITAPIHVVGHDIGGMIAYALASRRPHRVQSVIWGECPLPGTQTYHLDRIVPSRTTQQFHFVFHTVPDLAAALVAGKEKLYVEHFLRKICHRLDAFSDEDVEFYAEAYARPGIMRNAMEMYATFERDAVENREWIRKEGKCRVPTMVLSGGMSGHKDEAEGMAREVIEGNVVEVGVVKGAGHYLAEERPEEFVDVVLGFVGRH